jgi:hypothetical protein
VRPHWDFAAELLLKAAQTRAEDDIEAATAQMERAFCGCDARNGAIIFCDIVGKLALVLVWHAVKGYHCGDPETPLDASKGHLANAGLRRVRITTKLVR